MTNKNFGALFSDSLKMYKNDFSTIIKIALILFFIPILLQTIFGALGITILAVIFYIIYIITSITATIIIVRRLKTKSKGKFDLVKEFKVSIKSFWGYVGVSLRTVLFVFLWSLLFIIPGIIKAIQYAFSTFVFILEGKGAKQSMVTSRAMVKGRGWKVFGYIILINLIVSAVYWIIMTIAVVLGAYVYALIYSILIAIIMPYGLIFMKNFYDSLKTK